MHQHFLQTTAWQAFQEARGRQVYEASGDGWHYRAILEPGSRLTPSRLYCPYGPTITSETSLAQALQSLKQLGRKLGVGFIRVEPLGASFDASALKLREVEYSQPSHTWHIDLSPAPEEIIASMKQNNRSIYRNYQKKGLTYRETTDPTEITHLLTLLHGVATMNDIQIHEDDYLTLQADTLMSQHAAMLHFIEYENEVIAAALTYQTATTWYYAHAAASHTHRKLAASTALLAEIILHAKTAGAKTCDLYGVTTSDDPQHRWAGFTRFKKSFGGHLVTLSPTYELPLRPIQYATYQHSKTALRFVRKNLRRIRNIVR